MFNVEYKSELNWYDADRLRRNCTPWVPYNIEIIKITKEKASQHNIPLIVKLELKEIIGEKSTWLYGVHGEIRVRYKYSLETKYNLEIVNNIIINYFDLSSQNPKWVKHQEEDSSWDVPWGEERYYDFYELKIDNGFLDGLNGKMLVATYYPEQRTLTLYQELEEFLKKGKTSLQSGKPRPIL